MDSKTVGKSSEHVNLADGDRLSKMPAATAEQLNLAKILSKQESDAELKQSVILLQELAKCSEDEAVTALYDCENDIQKAVDLLLDKLRSGQSDWHTTGRKSRVKHATVTDSNGPISTHIKGSDKQTAISVNQRSSQGKFDESSGSPKQSDNAPVTSRSNRGQKHPRKMESVPTELTESQTSNTASKSSVRSVGSKDQRSSVKCSGLRDGWDPYTEYGGWGGEAIEVVNSNASLAHGLQTELAPADDLFLDTNKPTQEAASTLTTESSSEALSPKSTVQSDGDSLFISKACSKPPGLAFTKLPNVPVFIIPDAIPRTGSNLSFKFGDHGLSHETSSTVAAMLNANGRSLPSTGQPELESQLYSSVQAHRAIRNLESIDSLSNDTIISERKSETQQQQVMASSQYQNGNVAPKSPSTFPADPSGQPNTAFNSDRLSAQAGFLESSLKNYLLDNLPNDLSKLSVGNSGIRSEPTPQFSLPASSQPHGQPSSTGTTIQQQINKPSLPHLTTHSSFHSSPQQPLVSNPSQQSQAATLPPGMTHFISQFAPAPYHMFNSGNAPAVLEQLFHQQHRMFYDMHLHQQAATTAQSLLTSSSETSATSKPHTVPGPMNHVTAAGAPIRPDILASAMGPAPQMLPTGHPFFSYPGFVLMNGYPNTFMNQSQSGADSGSAPHGNPSMTQAGSQSSTSQSFSGIKPMNPAFDEFLDMKYGDPSKQVGYKSQSSSNFGNFQGHMDGAGSKLSASHSTTNGVLTPGFGMNSGASSGNSNQPFLPQYYQPGVSLNAAVALAQQQQQQQQHHQSQHQGPSTGTAVNQSSAAGVAGAGQAGGQMHQLGNNHAQPLVMGSSGPAPLHHAHHHPSQRSVMSHQH